MNADEGLAEHIDLCRASTSLPRRDSVAREISQRRERTIRAVTVEDKSVALLSHLLVDPDALGSPQDASGKSIARSFSIRRHQVYQNRVGTVHASGKEFLRAESDV